MATARSTRRRSRTTRIRVDKVDSIAETLPDAWKESGKLKVGIGSFDAPPLILYADDETTLIGNEIDIAYLVADTLGLEIEVEPTSWENLFLSVESGQYDVGVRQHHRHRGAQGEVRLRLVPRRLARLRGAPRTATSW